MPSRASSRVYNSLALEHWFTRVLGDWEEAFDDNALRRGREYYRGGMVSGLELTENDAIVHCSFGRKNTCYSIIEWNEQGPCVRGSTDDRSTGAAVAAAGLYEIEELIADEIAPLPYKPNDQNRGKDKPETASLPKPEATKGERASRPLRLQVKGIRAGLRLTATWLEPDGTRHPAFRKNGAALVEKEREQLVRLAGMAREVGFTFRASAGDYVLSDIERIAPFFLYTMPRWEEHFGALELDTEARQMADGVRPVEIVGHAEPAGSNSMRLDWRFRLGGRRLEPGDAARLARAGRGTHVIPGLGLVRIEPDQSTVLSKWRVAAGFDKLQIWPRYMAFSLFENSGIELDLGKELQQWRNSLSNFHDGIEAVPLPEFLRDYQVQGARWMANLQRHECHGLLADEMGLGKTVQVLTLLARFPIQRKQCLIVCPASVVPVWESEAAYWYPELETTVLSRTNTFAPGGPCRQPKLWIASYTQLRRHKHLLGEVDFGYAILDEAQQIKNPDAKVTQACCAIRAESRFALTGTPLENRVLDLWTIFRFLMPGLLGPRRSFEALVEQDDAESRRSFELRLRKQIAPFILRREKEAVGDELPPKVEMDLVCPITDLQRQTYEALLTRGRNELGDDMDAAMQEQTMHFFSLLTRLRQACCDPGLIPGVSAGPEQSGKVRILLTRLQEALSDNPRRKVVVFSQFVQLLKRLKPAVRRALPEATLLELTGSTKDRAKPVAVFQKHEGPAVIFVSLRAGGTGITLHSADYVFLLDPWWNPAVENQAIDRVHRIGQNRHVFVYRMITKGTVEERIQHLKKEKREMFQNTLGEVGSAADLKAHFGDLQELAKLLLGD